MDRFQTFDPPEAPVLAISVMTRKYISLDMFTAFYRCADAKESTPWYFNLLGQSGAPVP